MRRTQDESGAPSSAAYLMSDFASASRSLVQSLNRCNALTEATFKPASSRRALSSRAGVPSANSRPAISLRISTADTPADFARFKNSSSVPCGKHVRFSANWISVTVINPSFGILIGEAENAVRPRAAARPSGQYAALRNFYCKKSKLAIMIENFHLHVSTCVADTDGAPVRSQFNMDHHVEEKL